MGNILKEIIQAMKNGLLPLSDGVQKLMRRHYHWLELTWTPTKESYLGLTELYQTSEFRTFYDNLHPKLLPCFIEVMKIFSENVLS